MNRIFVIEPLAGLEADVIGIGIYDLADVVSIAFRALVCVSTAANDCGDAYEVMILNTIMNPSVYFLSPFASNTTGSAASVPTPSATSVMSWMLCEIDPKILVPVPTSRMYSHTLNFSRNIALNSR